jgi:hypothetical protein
MAKVVFEDLSGTSTPVTSNPFDGLINATEGDPVRSKKAYGRLPHNLIFASG